MFLLIQSQCGWHWNLSQWLKKLGSVGRVLLTKENRRSPVWLCWLPKKLSLCVAPASLLWLYCLVLAAALTGDWAVTLCFTDGDNRSMRAPPGGPCILCLQIWMVRILHFSVSWCVKGAIGLAERWVCYSFLCVLVSLKIASFSIVCSRYAQISDFTLLLPLWSWVINIGLTSSLHLSFFLFFILGGLSIWAISPEERNKHDQKFDTLSPLMGYVSGNILLPSARHTADDVTSSFDEMHHSRGSAASFSVFRRGAGEKVFPPVRPTLLSVGWNMVRTQVVVSFTFQISNLMFFNGSVQLCAPGLWLTWIKMERWTAWSFPLPWSSSSWNSRVLRFHQHCQSSWSSLLYLPPP